jgi:MYXO-CTERM domain-containing protein
MKGLQKPLARLHTLVIPWLSAFAVLLFAGVAFAGVGSFKLRSTTVSEVSGGWHIYCEIQLPKPPPTAHQTLKFLFTKTAVYERDLVDNNPKPVTNRQALVGQQPSVESLEVDFADASGKIFNITRFDFTITRIRGYEAGEYKIQLRTSDGVDIGGFATLTLNGDNPVVDRRAMAFDAKNPNMKKVSSGIDGGATGPKTDDSVAAVPNNGEVTPAGTAPPFLTDDAFKKQPEEMHERPKGCGCDVPGAGAAGATAGLAALGLLIATLGLRRRRS